MQTRILDCPKCGHRFEYGNDGEIPDMIGCPKCGASSVKDEYSALMLCPHCRKKLAIPLDLLQEPELQCPHCMQNFPTAESSYISELDSDTTLSELDRKNLQPVSLLAEGEIFDKFQITRLLGRGGMAEVYLAEHILLKQTCALKLLTGVQLDTILQKRFIREARLAHEISHPNIVKVFDVGIEPRSGRPFIAMEYVEGDNLSGLARKKPFTEAELWEVLRVMNSALQALEEKKIVHRDIKPSNIIRKPDGTLKLMDLGIAKAAADETSGELTLTMTQSVMGTPGFASPEQSQSSHNTDTRSDIFSLGATLYFLACGQYPFDGNTAIEIILNVMNTEPEPLEKRRTDLSVKFVELVRKMMAKSPDARPQNTEELQRLIDRDESSKTMRLLHRIYAQMPWKKGGRRWKLPVIFVLFLMAALSVLYWSGRPKTDRIPMEKTTDAPEHTGTDHAAPAASEHISGPVKTPSVIMRGDLPNAEELFYPLSPAPDGSYILASLNAAKSPPQALLLNRVYAPPFEIRAVCSVQLTNVRFRLCRGTLIFNWERNSKMLQVNIPGIKSAEVENADGQIPCNQWVEYRIAVTPDRMDIYAGGKLRQTVHGTFSAGPVGMYTCCGSQLKVRSFTVKSGSGGGSEPLSLTVNTDQDKEDPADRLVSLREAVTYAGVLAEEPVIRFQHDMTSRLAKPLAIRRNITIDGGKYKIRLIGPAKDQLFTLHGRRKLELKNLELQSDFQGKGAGIAQVNGLQSIHLFDINDPGSTAKLNWRVTGNRASLILSGRSSLHRIEVASSGTLELLTPDTIVSGVAIHEESPKSRSYMFMQEGKADNVRITGFSCCFVRGQALARNITVQSGAHLGIQGGQIQNFTVAPGCGCAYRNGARMSGRITLSSQMNRAGKISRFSLDPQSEIVFDLTQLKPSEKTLLDDLKRFSGAKTYEIRVQKNQPAGTYALCGNAAGIQIPFNLQTADRTYPGVLHPGKDFTAGSVRYRLSVTKKNILELTITRR